MRLLRTGTFEKKVEILQFGDHDTPRYAILSHVWDTEEVTFQDMVGPSAAQKPGYEKVRMACSVAAADGYDYVWIDTCCIDKTSSAELSEAINSMYHWYQEADECYAYLADVPSKAKFSGSKWFTRGWTLQELIAPSTIRFLDKKWERLGTKATLQQDISNRTHIPVSILSGDEDLEKFSVAQRMSWAAERETTRIEDRAYCLLGIFGINMPPIYGERENSFIRLQEEIMRISDDHSLFTWKSPSPNNGSGLLATSPDAFHGCGNIVQFDPFDGFNSPLTVSSRGIHLELRFIGVGRPGLGLAILHCKERDGEDKPIAIYVKDLFLTMEQFERARSGEFERLDLNKFELSQYPVRRICIRKARMTRMRTSKDLGKCDSIAPEVIYPDIKVTNSALLLAAERGNEDVVWLLLTRSNIEDRLKDYGLKALLLAVKGGHEVVVKILLARSDVKVNLKDEDGRTPLSWAAQIGNDAIVKLLLRSGKVEASSNDKHNWTPLSYAVREEHEAIVRLLLEKGADTEIRDNIHRHTPLLYAVGNKHEALVRLLLEKGADIEAKFKLIRRTPLSFAAEKGYEAIVRLFLERGANIEAKDTSTSQTPLLYAIQEGHETIVQLLLEKGADTEAIDTSTSQTPLLRAAVKGQTAVVRLLLDNGADIEVKDEYRRTPLSYAAESGYKDIVRLLLKNGANTETKDVFHEKPLWYTAENRQEAVIESLRSRKRWSSKFHIFKFHDRKGEQVN